MEEVSRVELALELARRRRVLQHRVKVGHGVEHAAVPDKVVHALARRLAHGARVRLHARVEPRRAERRDRRAEHGQVRRVRARDELFECRDERVPDLLLCGLGRGRDADVVHALEDHRVPHARLREDVAVESSQGVRPESVGEDAVPAGGLVREREGGEGGVVGGLESREEEIGPAIVAVVVAAAAVGDAVTNDRDGANRLGDPCIERADEVPAENDMSSARFRVHTSQG